MKNKDLPAMPIPLNDGQSFSHHGEADGLTKREYFAAHAPDMPEGWIARVPFTKEEQQKMSERTHARLSSERYARAIVAWRWHYADMMLEGEK